MTTVTTPTKKRWVTPVLCLVAAIAIGLFGGVLIGHSSASATNASSTTGLGGAPGGTTGGTTGGGTGTRTGGDLTSGTITSISGDVITLKLTDGTTVKVNTSSTTKVTKSDTAAVTDLAKGDKLSVVGTTDSSGNVTATTVTEGATTMGGFGGGTPPTGTNG
jgi:hypothetical protein